MQFSCLGHSASPPWFCQRQLSLQPRSISVLFFLSQTFSTVFHEVMVWRTRFGPSVNGVLRRWKLSQIYWTERVVQSTETSGRTKDRIRYPKKRLIPESSRHVQWVPVQRTWTRDKTSLHEFHPVGWHLQLSSVSKWSVDAPTSLLSTSGMTRTLLTENRLFIKFSHAEGIDSRTSVRVPKPQQRKTYLKILGLAKKKQVSTTRSVILSTISMPTWRETKKRTTKKTFSWKRETLKRALKKTTVGKRNIQKKKLKSRQKRGSAPISDLNL